MRAEELKSVSEDELLRGCLKNKRPYQEALYRRFADKMYQVAWTYAKNDDEASDVLQEAFIQVFRKLKDFKNQGSLEGWIRKVVVNKALEHYRAQRRKEEVLEEYRADKESSIDHLLSQINAQEIIRQVNALPEKAALVLKLYAIEGYAHQEIAQMMDISVGTSKSQLNRARQLLQEKLRSLNG